MELETLQVPGLIGIAGGQPELELEVQLLPRHIRESSGPPLPPGYHLGFPGLVTEGFFPLASQCVELRLMTLHEAN